MTGTHPPLKPEQRLIVDFGPLLVFFIINLAYGIYAATVGLIVVMPVAMLLSWRMNKAISPMLWLSTILIFTFGGLTLYFADERFIKLKPTILFTVFGLVLLSGWLRKKPLVKHLLDPALPSVTNDVWLVLTRNWGFFFLIKAALNEIVWRSVSTDSWVLMKTFGYPLVTFCFVVAHYPLLTKYSQK